MFCGLYNLSKIIIFLQNIISEPSDLTLKIYRAESYAGLQEFKAAIEDLNAVLFQLPHWPEVKLLSVNCIHFKMSSIGNVRPGY